MLQKKIRKGSLAGKNPLPSAYNNVLVENMYLVTSKLIKNNINSMFKKEKEQENKKGAEFYST